MEAKDKQSTNDFFVAYLCSCGETLIDFGRISSLLLVFGDHVCDDFLNIRGVEQLVSDLTVRYGCFCLLYAYITPCTHCRKPKSHNHTCTHAFYAPSFQSSGLFRNESYTCE